ncbi:hypothetical protein IP70_13420 [alpha proteobacterium AAP38]|nr:hypothetical protein IP70_13420 [alpha proteobacterium AAP38]
MLFDNGSTDMLAGLARGGGVDHVPWHLFESNGQLSRGGDLVVSRFVRRALAANSLNNHVKTIVQARFMLRPDIHTPQLNEGCLVDEFGQIGGSQGRPDHHAVPGARLLVLNHYFTKSRAKWHHKRSQRWAIELTGSTGWLRPDHHFKAHNLNDVEDRLLAHRAGTICAEMERLQRLMS